MFELKLVADVKLLTPVAEYKTTENRLYSIQLLYLEVKRQ